MRNLITLLALFSVAVPARAQVDVGYDKPPGATEAELFSRSVVVVRGRVEGKRLEAEAGPTTSVYSVRVLELLKSDGRQSVGAVIDVHRHGGLEAKNVDRDFSPFEASDEVVLFLERGQNGWYWPVNGPDGAFKLKDGRAHAYGKVGEVSRRHHGRIADEFLAELRKQKK